MKADPRIKELRQKDAKELDIDLKGLREELFKLRFQSSTEKLANPARIAQIKRQVARILTLQKQREAATPSNARN
jgi:large subunit ribosomal protein L29